MLVDLIVENFAVIEKVLVRFHHGLNLLTGETGSGKSLVVDALGLLFGGRTSAELVRSGAERARITGIFETVPTPALQKLLESAGIEIEDQELIVEREILANGKSRAFVGSRAATAALLKELSGHLGDIHGQHDQQLLFSPTVQREMLDVFAGNEKTLESVASIYREWRKRSDELAELDTNAQENLRLADLWAFQRKEIEAVAPEAGEELLLENERRVLRNVVHLEETAAAAYNALYDAPESVTSQMRGVVRRLEDLAKIDDTIGAILSVLQPSTFAVEEAAHALRSYLGSLEADPGRLDEVETRLAALEKLRRKYGPSIDEVLAFFEDVKEKLASVENTTERREELQKQIASLAKDYRTTAENLTNLRSSAAKQLAKRVAAELASLAMEKTRVEIRIQPGPWSEHGADQVEILFAANPGEDPKPLEKTASGGELSRVALALKTCTAKPPSKGTAPRTLVFDEVDAGVGGSAAESVGRRLKKLAESNQILCVTHLPQIAGFADHHYHVEKRTAKGRTSASIDELTPVERTHEIGRMLSGERVTPEALKHAEQLIKMAAG